MAISGFTKVGPVVTCVCTECNFFLECYEGTRQGAVEKLDAVALKALMHKRQKGQIDGCYLVTYITTQDKEGQAHLVTKWDRSSFPHECSSYIWQKIFCAKSLLLHMSRETNCRYYGELQMDDSGTNALLFKTWKRHCRWKVKEHAACIQMVQE